MWQGIVGHDRVVEQFRRTLASGRLASTYLFVGPPGIGKRRFALEFAHALLCSESEDAALAPCGRCESCQLFAAGNHPDLETVGLPADKSALPISLFVGDDEHRNQEGLCHRIARSPYFGRRRIAIVDDADHFSIASANCLLKILEEPPPSALLILIGTSLARQLPTIRSRSQIVRFQPLDGDAVAQILLETGLVADRRQAEQAADRSTGSVELARQLSDPDLSQFREQLLAALQSGLLDRVRLARAVHSFVDEAGKEPSRRRDRLRAVIGFAVDFYRQQLRRAAAPPAAGGCPDYAESILRALDGSIAALEYVDRNANQAMLIHAWCDELAALAAEAPPIRPARTVA
jgi:DNA polymerase-3 subunit delta'